MAEPPQPQPPLPQPPAPHARAPQAWPENTGPVDVMVPLGPADGWIDEPPAPRKVRRPTFASVGGIALAAGVAAAVFGNLALRADVTNVAAFYAVALTSLALLTSGRATRQHTRLLIAAAVLLAAWLPIRASGWLAHLNSWTAVALLGAAALFDGGTPLRLSFGFANKVLGRLLESRWAGHLFAVSTKPSSSGFRSAALPVLRGFALAAIPVLVLGAILASADTVFASTISFGWNPGALIGHLMLTAVVGFAVFGLLCISSADDGYPSEQPRPIGAVEGLVVLASVAALYASFVVIQVLGAFGVTDHILEEQGVTLKDYAREGFFQLLLVAGLTLCLLISVQALTRPGSTRLRQAHAVIGAVLSLLTVVIVAVSISRIQLYTEGFGQTTLRWYSSAFAWLLGALFVLFAAHHLTPGKRSWFGQTAVMVVLATLFAVNVLNPEARVAQHNLTHEPSAQRVDAEYLTRLSADAWPTILEHRERVSDLLDQRMTPHSRYIASDWDRPIDQPWIEWRCERADRGGGYGPFGFNLARSHLSC